MKKSDDLDTNQILKYFNNEMSEQELIAFKKLLEDEKHLNEFKKHVITDHYVQLSKTEFDHQKISSRQKYIKNTKTIAKTPKNKLNNYLKYAAVFIGLLIGITLFYTKSKSSTSEVRAKVTLQQNNGSLETIKDDAVFQEIKNEEGDILGFQEKNKIVYKNDKRTNTKEGLIINTLRVPYGKKFELVLSDGTKIHINAGSTLKFPSQFIAGQVREVALSGEAYFEVAKNEEDPFIVTTNGIRTEVLGTKFNVSSYSDDHFSEVVLVEGSVGIFNNQSRFNQKTDQILTPNQKASLLKSSQNINISTVKAENYIAWKDDVLLFTNEDFVTIMKKLERFYNKKVTINNQKIKNEKFTGRFDVEKIEDVLKTFRSNTFFKYSIKENEIIINP